MDASRTYHDSVQHYRCYQLAIGARDSNTVEENDFSHLLTNACS